MEWQRYQVKPKEGESRGCQVRGGLGMTRTSAFNLAEINCYPAIESGQHYLGVVTVLRVFGEV